MSFLYSPVLIATLYAGGEVAKKSKGMPLHIIIPFTIAMVPVFFGILVWLSPRLEKKFGQEKETKE